MGLRSQRWSWAGVADSAHSISDGQDLGVAPIMPAGWQQTDSKIRINKENVMAGVLVVVILVLLIVFLVKRV
jgi:hypothetical protein